MDTMDHIGRRRQRKHRAGDRRRWGVRTFVAPLTLAVALLLVAGGAHPAAAEPWLSVTPSTGLDPSGAFVVVSGGGYAPNSQLFVMQCRSTSTEDHTCNSVGLRKVTTDANGAFTANAMRLVARFGATDCTATACSVMTSAVSDHSEDRSQDRSVAIGFAAPAPAPPPPPALEPTNPTPPPAPQTPAPPSGDGASEPAPPPGAEPAPTEPASPVSEPEPPTTTGESGPSDDEAVRGERPDGADGAESFALADDAPAAGSGGGGGPGLPLAIGGGLTALAAAGGGLVWRTRRGRVSQT